MPRIAKTPAEIRREAVQECRDVARIWGDAGSGEAASALRQAADAIARIRPTKDM